MQLPIGDNRLHWHAWRGRLESVALDDDGILDRLSNLDRCCRVIEHEGAIGVSHEGSIVPDASSGAGRQLAFIPPLRPQDLGSPLFLETFRLELAYMAGAMANGISSEDFVIHLGRAGILSSFGNK